MKYAITALVVGALLAFGVKEGSARPDYGCPDPTGDGVVSILDISKVASKFGLAEYEGPEDVTGDGAVSILDISYVAAWFGENCPEEALPPAAETLE